jgi:hypothetical protein
MIHDVCGNAQPVVDAAKALTAKGVPTATAYEQALNAFATANPDMAQPLSHATRLIEASDPATVDQYDAALAQYIATGSNTALVAMAPTIAADSMAFAIASGDMSPEEIATGGLAMALGYEPSNTLRDALPAAPAAPTGPAPAAAPEPGASQVSPFGAGGFVGVKARANPGHYSGFAPDAPALHGLTPKAAYEAARAQASGRSGAVFTDTAATA